MTDRQTRTDRHRIVNNTCISYSVVRVKPYSIYIIRLHCSYFVHLWILWLSYFPDIEALENCLCFLHVYYDVMNYWLRHGVGTGILNWTDSILLPHNTLHDHKQKTYHNRQRIVSGSNAFVLRLPKNQCFWRIYDETNHKTHAVTRRHNYFIRIKIKTCRTQRLPFKQH